MFIKPDENGKYLTKQLPNRLMLALRAIVGFYLCYLVYGLRNNFVPPYNRTKIICIIASVIFLAVAVTVIVTSIRSFVTGRYQGGALDAGVLEDEAVKHIEGLDDNVSKNDSVSQTAKPSAVSDGSDDFDPHDVVYKRK